ncbi:MAG: acyl-homoserine-lactone synthase [Maricaulaceae bacterium]
MVEIVNGLNHHLYTERLQELYAFRHRVACGEMGWKLPDAKNGLDIDQFDTEDAIHFIDSNSKGEIIACARLVPTTGPNMLRDVFPEFCDGDEPPCSPHTYEYTRYLVTKEGTSQEEFIRARARILVAIHEFCLANDIRKLSLLTYQKHYALAAFLFRTRPLGQAQYYEADDDYYIAMTNDVSPEGLAKARQYTNLHDPVGFLKAPLDAAKRLTEEKTAA